jgi:hypothetical protein
MSAYSLMGPARYQLDKDGAGGAAMLNKTTGIFEKQAWETSERGKKSLEKRNKRRDKDERERRRQR